MVSEKSFNAKKFLSSLFFWTMGCLAKPSIFFPKNSKPIIKPLPSAFMQKKIWANSTFLWAANRDFVTVVEKSVKFGAKSPETGPKL